MIGIVQSGHGAAQRDVVNGVYLALGDLYPGSLNLRTERGELVDWGEPDLIIPGPECPLWLWKAHIGDVDVWVMHPHRWPPIQYAEIAEVFASVRLRDELDLSDGSEVWVER